MHYHFVTEEAFDRLVSENAFLEHATVHGHRYGTLRAPVERLMAEGFNVLLDIDPQGAHHRDAECRRLCERIYSAAQL